MKVLGGGSVQEHDTAKRRRSDGLTVDGDLRGERSGIDRNCASNGAGAILAVQGRGREGDVNTRKDSQHLEAVVSRCVRTKRSSNLQRKTWASAG